MTPLPSPPALIETMRLCQGRIARWPGHRARLQASAHALDYPLDINDLEDRLARATAEISARTNHLPPSADEPAGNADHAPAWRIRLLLAADGQLSLEVSPLPDTHTPVRIALARDTIGTSDPLDSSNPWLRHKTTHRVWFSEAQRWLAAHPDHFDLIFGNQSEDLCEGSRCNIYIQDDHGRWLTPPTSCGLLPGVERQWLLGQGLAHEARVSLNDLRQAPAWRISNALRGWQDACLETQTGRINSLYPSRLIR